jgi:hypothetical protein
MMGGFIPRVHFDDGAGAVCGASSPRVVSTLDETTCESCRSTMTTQTVEPADPNRRYRTFRYVVYARSANGGARLWSGDPFPIGLRVALEEHGFEITRDVDLEAPPATSCTCGKAAYRSERVATKTALRRSGKAGHGLRVYRCPVEAGVWHLTKKPSREVA